MLKVEDNMLFTFICAFSGTSHSSSSKLAEQQSREWMWGACDLLTHPGSQLLPTSSCWALWFCFCVQTRDMLDVCKAILSFLQHPSSFYFHPLAILLRKPCYSCFKTQNTGIGHGPQFLQFLVGLNWKFFVTLQALVTHIQPQVFFSWHREGAFPENSLFP